VGLSTAYFSTLDSGAVLWYCTLTLGDTVGGTLGGRRAGRGKQSRFASSATTNSPMRRER
jgi:hypothetical protein